MFASRRRFGVSHAIGLVVGVLALSGAVVYYVMRKARNAAKSNHTSTHA